MASTQDLGNGLGYIYIVENNGFDILSTITNNSRGVSSIILDGVNRGPVGGNVVATGTIEVLTAVDNGVTSAVNINGIQQMGSSIAPVAMPTTQQAIEIANRINTYVPGAGPDFTAVAIGSTVIIYGPSTNPESVNGNVISIVDSSSSTYSITNMSGGSSGDSVSSEQYGRRYFYNADFGGTPATIDDLTGAVEITSFIINRGFQGSLAEDVENDVQSNVTYTRLGSIQNLSVSGLNVTVNTISTSQTSVGDIIVIRNVKNDGYVQIDDNSVGGGNILTSGQSSWRSEGPATDNDCIILQARNDGALPGTYWVEIGRSSSLPPEVSVLRINSYPQPNEGSEQVALPTSGDLTLTAGTTKKYVEITGSPTLIGNVNIEGDLTDVLFGDEFFVTWQANPTLGGFQVQLEGVQIDTLVDISQPFIMHGHFSISGIWEWSIHYDLYNSTGFIQTDHYADDSIPSSKLQVNSVVTSNITDLNVTEDKIAALAITNSKLGAGAVSVDKLDADLQTWVLTSSVSFETGELGEYHIQVPFDCTVTSIYAVVTKTIEATNDGVLTPKNDGGTTMTGGIINSIAGATNPTSYTSTPTANNTFTAGETIILQTTKTTPGGKLLVSVTITRT